MQSQQTESTQQQATQPSSTVQHEKQQQIVQKVKEFFEKKSFFSRKYASTEYNKTQNAVSFYYLAKELKEDNHKEFDQALKSEELKEFIVYQEGQWVAPTWKRLRNIFLINQVNKDSFEQLQTLIKNSINPEEVQLTINAIGENAQVIITTPNKENEQTKLIFEKLFNQKIKIGAKELTLNFCIEEETVNFVPNTSGNNQNMYHHLAPMAKFENQAQQTQWQQHLLAQQQWMYQFQMAASQQNRTHFKGNNGGAPHHANAHHQNHQQNKGAPQNVQAGNLHQPASMNQQKNARNSFKVQKQQEKAKFPKTNIKSQGHRAQNKAFNATEVEFPSLQ